MKRTMMYRRAYTTWHSRSEHGLVWIDGDEGTGARLVKFGGVTYGTHKWDRLPMADAPADAQAHAICVIGDRCDYHLAEVNNLIAQGR